MDREPEVDPSQDYQLLLGYENSTHTVLRFRRRLDTCDHHDIPITVRRTKLHIKMKFHDCGMKTFQRKRLPTLPFAPAKSRERSGNFSSIKCEGIIRLISGGKSLNATFATLTLPLPVGVEVKTE